MANLQNNSNKDYYSFMMATVFLAQMDEIMDKENSVVTKQGPEKKEKTRCFFGIALAPEWHKAIINITARLKKRRHGEQIHWAELSNIHLTLRFIGEIDEDVLQKIVLETKEKLSTLEHCALRKAKLSEFPPHHPRIVAITFPLDLALAKIINTLEVAVNNCGIPHENRAFLPHLTLGKTYHKKLPDLSEIEAKLPKKLMVEEIILFRSTVVATTRVYLPIMRMPLRQASTKETVITKK